jgi:hypothetical protein
VVDIGQAYIMHWGKKRFVRFYSETLCKEKTLGDTIHLKSSLGMSKVRKYREKL